MATFDQFSEFYFSEFTQHNIWAVMSATVEDSPWHREANVAVHTEMAIEFFMKNFGNKYSEREQVIAMTALLFHDSGKPSAEETITREDGHVYRRYAGHEQDSAITFQEFYVTSQKLRNMFTVKEARLIKFMIEHHLPFGLKNERKLKDLVTAMAHTFKEANASFKLFFDMVKSDASGRISDNHEEKLQAVDEWFFSFEARFLNLHPPKHVYNRNMYLMVGPSGSGKSTLAKKMAGPDDQIISLDDFRIQYFLKEVQPVREDGDSAKIYLHAWNYVLEHESQFNKFAEEQIKEMLNKAVGTNSNVFIDATNVSKKRRAQWIERANKFHFNVKAFEFWNTMDVLVARQFTRNDKTVPRSSVRQQQYSTQSVYLGAEADEVTVIIQG